MATSVLPHMTGDVLAQKHTGRYSANVGNGHGYPAILRARKSKARVVGPGGSSRANSPVQGSASQSQLGISKLTLGSIGQPSAVPGGSKTMASNLGNLDTTSESETESTVSEENTVQAPKVDQLAEIVEPLIRGKIKEPENQDKERKIHEIKDGAQQNSILLEHRMDLIVEVCKENLPLIEDMKSEEVFNLFEALKSILTEPNNGIINLQQESVITSNLKDFVAVRNPFETLLAKLVVTLKQSVDIETLKSLVHKESQFFGDLKFFVLLEEMGGLEADQGINVLLYSDKNKPDSYLSLELFDWVKVDPKFDCSQLDLEQNIIQFKENLEKFLNDIREQFEESVKQQSQSSQTYNSDDFNRLQDEWIDYFKIGAIFSSKNPDVVFNYYKLILGKNTDHHLDREHELLGKLLPGKIKVKA